MGSMYEGAWRRYLPDEKIEAILGNLRDGAPPVEMNVPGIRRRGKRKKQSLNVGITIDRHGNRTGNAAHLNCLGSIVRQRLLQGELLRLETMATDDEGLTLVIRLECPPAEPDSASRKLSEEDQTLPDEPALSPKDACATLHELLEQLPVYGADVDLDLLPACSGIYFFCQRTGADWEPSAHGEALKGIVRIGISRGTRGRISDHYHGVIPIADISLNRFCPKDRSIMRKHIGRALLSRPGHPHADYLPIWNADMTTPAKRDAFRGRRNTNIEKAIECEVSDVMARDFYFRCVAGKSDDEVDKLETSAIGIVSSCPSCRRSKSWLGRSHPNPVISEGKLWNVKKVTVACPKPLRLALLARRIQGSL